MTGHEIGLLKGYMQDIVEQAHQESAIFSTAGFKENRYTPDQALMDLLAILDDRLESEGVQVGLSEEFRFQMGKVCQRARGHVNETAWLSANLSEPHPKKAEIQSIAYRALLKYIETEEI